MSSTGLLTLDNLALVLPILSAESPSSHGVTDTHQPNQYNKYLGKYPRVAHHQLMKCTTRFSFVMYVHSPLRVRLGAATTREANRTEQKGNIN